MINTLTLNPAIDKILYVDKFTPNVTTRINRVVETIGGKGTHVSVNLEIMGGQNRAFGIAHGPTGARVIEMLEEEGVDVRFLYHKKQNTRTNYLLAEATGDSTLITEKGVQLGEADLLALIQKLEKETQAGDFLVFSGDASNYADPYVYNHIMDALRDCGLKYFLDTSGASLKKSVQNAPFLIKPNLSELSALLDRVIPEEQGAVVDAIRALDRYNIEVIAVSLGGSGSIVKCGDTVYKASPPKVSVQNTVGCGDCFLAGLLYGFDQKKAFTDILAYATAASAAAAECELSVGFDAARANELVEEVKLEELA